MNTGSTLGRVRIAFKSYDHRLLDELMKDICAKFKANDMKIGGPIAVPIKSIAFSIRRAPSIYKGSMERFEKRIYSRIILLYGIKSKDLTFLSSMSIPHLVDIKISVENKKSKQI